MLSSDDNYIHDETLIIQKSLSTNDDDTPCEGKHFLEYNRPRKHQIFQNLGSPAISKLGKVTVFLPPSKLARLSLRLYIQQSTSGTEQMSSCHIFCPCLWASFSHPLKYTYPWFWSAFHDHSSIGCYECNRNECKKPEKCQTRTPQVHRLPCCCSSCAQRSPDTIDYMVYTTHVNIVCFSNQCLLYQPIPPWDLKLETQILDNTALHSLLFSPHISGSVNNTVMENESSLHTITKKMQIGIITPCWYLKLCLISDLLIPFYNSLTHIKKRVISTIYMLL